MEHRPAKLRIFRIKNGKRAFKPESTFKFTTELNAREYIDKHGLCLYDLYVGEQLIDRDGGGAVAKYDGPKKKNPPKEIEYVCFDSVIKYLTEGTGVVLSRCFELKKGSGMIAVSCSNRNDANAVYTFVKRSEHLRILEILQSALSLSVETTSSHFNKTKTWQKNQNPLPAATLKLLPTGPLCDFSELKESFGRLIF